MCETIDVGLLDFDMKTDITLQLTSAPINVMEIDHWFDRQKLTMTRRQSQQHACYGRQHAPPIRCLVPKLHHG
jgi:hypothetical protein